MAKVLSYQIDVVLVNEGELDSPSFNELAAFLQPLADQLKLNKEICIKIVDVKESQYLNNAYRGKDKPTNVLSFPSEIPDFVASPLLGDLAICSAVVKQEAQEQSKNLKHHWAHMTIHGCLHLLGFDHIDDDEAEVMEGLEVALLGQLGIANPYIANLDAEEGH